MVRKLFLWILHIINPALLADYYENYETGYVLCIKDTHEFDEGNGRIGTCRLALTVGKKYKVYKETKHLYFVRCDESTYGYDNKKAGGHILSYGKQQFIKL